MSKKQIASIFCDNFNKGRRTVFSTLSINTVSVKNFYLMTYSADISCKILSNNSAKVTLVLMIYCISGTLLTLVNKFAVNIFPYANTLLVLQNGMGVLLLLLTSQFCRSTLGTLPPLNLTVLQLWMPLVLLFVMMLISSLLTLMYVSVPTVIVMRNLTTLFVAVMEYVLLSHRINSFSAITLVFMLLGAILYAKHDLTFSIPGYVWLCVNILGTSIYQIYIKKIIHLPLFENVGSIGMSYYNNLISLPVLLCCAYITGELRILSTKFDFHYLSEIVSIGLIVLSGILGFSLSTSAFALNKRISATSMMVANNVNKFSMIILSEIFVESTLDITASIGAVSVLFLGWLYSQTAKSLSRRLLLMAAIGFITTSAVLEYRQIKSDMTNITYISHPNNIDGKSNGSTGLLTRENWIFTSMKKSESDGIYRSYIPVSETSKRPRLISPTILVKKKRKFQVPPICVDKNASIWKICQTSRCIPYTAMLHWHFPRTTNSGENTGDFVNRVLSIAWGSNPPSVDLYLRSGCKGIMEMKYLFESIEIFWPRFLGSIIVVLDVGDEVVLKYILPTKPSHLYVIEFEHTPCVSGRIFNQYSYLNLDRHSSADYVVTIDSDCIFHSPVTPDLIFREGRIILASSRTFQSEYWRQPVDFMLGAGMYDGHYMVTQPVTFALSTFSSFRQWFYETYNKCYEDRLSQLSSDNYLWFCWMCQLGTYLEKGNPKQNDYKKYWFQHLDNQTLEPMLRYSIHVTYEPYASARCEEPECYEKTANEVIGQGLCRAFGSFIFDFCTNYSNFSYVNNVTFFYAHADLQAADRDARISALTGYLERLSSVTMLAQHRSTKVQSYS